MRGAAGRRSSSASARRHGELQPRRRSTCSRAVDLSRAVAPRHPHGRRRRRSCSTSTRAKIGVDGAGAADVGDARSRRIRTGQYSDRDARASCSISPRRDAACSALPDPYRLVIDLDGAAVASHPESVRRGGTAASDAARPRAPRLGGRRPRDAAARRRAGRRIRAAAAGRRPPPADASPARRPRRGRRSCSIPGHGGDDPGARRRSRSRRT